MTNSYMSIYGLNTNFCCCSTMIPPPVFDNYIIPNIGDGIYFFSDLTENGEWGAKTKKVYVLDENGECVPLIDKKTGQQKVDKRNRKQWKCYTADSTGWNSRENAKMWRKDLADTINAANEQLGIAVHWEHRSFKEQGIDREPTIHIGAIANALERKGIQTGRGNINREIIKNNMLLEQAKEMLMLAKQEVRNVQKYAD